MQMTSDWLDAFSTNTDKCRTVKICSKNCIEINRLDNG